MKYELSDPARFEESLISQMNWVDILKQMKQLPEIYRDVLILRYVCDISNRKIAKIININEAAVRKRLERARKKLFEILKRKEDE